MNNSPAIYVGTYAKYNGGSIAGAWLDLDDYAGAEDFYAAARDLHKDEADPELMFQDWENIPDRFISESGLDAEYWDFLETIAGSHLDAEVFEAAADLGIEANMVEELYYGSYFSDEEFAMDLADNLGVLDSDVGWPYSCIDWERAARDLMMDYGESDGHYFRTSY